MTGMKPICSRCGAFLSAADERVCPTCNSGAARRGDPVVQAAVVCGAALFLLLGVALTGYCFAFGFRPEERPVAVLPVAPPPPAPAPPADDWRVALREVRARAAQPPRELLGETVTVESVVVETPPRIKKAIARGVEYLKSANYGAGGPVYGNRVGAAALAGLAMLECGVPADDPVIEKVAAVVRGAVGNLQMTYDVATCIWFLDRLGQRSDGERIRSLALRLMASQGPMGGWGYTCRLLGAEQESEFVSLLQQHPLPESYGQDVVKPAASDAPVVRPRVIGRSPAFVANLADLPLFKFEPGRPLALRPSGHEDNSLTQFAILALWAAQKHGVQVKRCLALVESRFRTYQNRDGSWGYILNTLSRRDSMTCAGLLGLAVGRGLGKLDRPKRPEKDEAIEKALLYLGLVVGRPPLASDPAAASRDLLRSLQTKLRNARTFVERAALLAEIQRLGMATVMGRGRFIGADGWGDLYFLWSLERMAVVYDLKTVAGKDWYAWGSEILVNAQQEDGSWADAFPGTPDTCFALLFLKRANVVKDLTAKLRLLGKVRDPGHRSDVKRLPGEDVKPDQP